MDPRFDVELVSVTKRYGTTVAVDNISLRIPKASYCCLLGPSGCGKTSSLRMIAGHENISSGDVLIDGRNVTGLAPVARGTAMMFQNYALFPHLSCLDNVAFSLKMRGVDRKAREAKAQQFLELVEMGAYASRLPAQLSGGQQQRVALARALIGEPRVHRPAAAAGRRRRRASGGRAPVIRTVIPTGAPGRHAIDRCITPPPRPQTASAQRSDRPAGTAER